jgi:5-methylcytosine-specific restriction endonuclease McrA
MKPYPKQKPVRKTGKEYHKFRVEVFNRYGGICQKCKNPAPLEWDGEFNLYYCGHVSHIKSHGAGGGDRMDNVTWLCYECHIEKEHGPRWSKRLG